MPDTRSNRKDQQISHTQQRVNSALSSPLHTNILSDFTYYFRTGDNRLNPSVLS